MIKYFTLIFTLALFFGCKSPVADFPIASLPDPSLPNDNASPEVPLIPEDENVALPGFPEEVPFIPPTGYIGEGGETDIAIDVVSEDLHVAFSNSTRRIKIDAYKDNEWVFVDSNTEQVQNNTESPIAITHVGETPYVIFADGKDNGKLRFKTFNGSAWVNVTEEKHLSTHPAPSTSIVSIGTDIYMAFSGYGETGRNITVKKYDTVSKDLTNLPSPYLKQASKIQLFGVDSKLHIVFASAEGYPAGYGFSFNGNEWVALGSSSGSSGGGLIPSSWGVSFLKGSAVNAAPHAVYQTTGALTLIKLENGVWSEVSKIATGKTSVLDFIAIDDVPYVAHTDPNYGDRLLVRYLGSDGSWKDVDTDKVFLSGANVNYVDMAYDNGILYVAFQDLSEEGAGRIKIVSFEL